MRNKINKAIKHFRNGIKYGYPICCVIDFVINNFTGKYKNVKRNRLRQKKGIKFDFSLCKRCHKKALKK
jgi:hypothetical protein